MLANHDEFDETGNDVGEEWSQENYSERQEFS